MKREKGLMEKYGGNAQKSEKKSLAKEKRKGLKKRCWYYGRKRGG